LVDVEHDRPGRARLVVVVANREHRCEAAEVDVVEPALVDAPAERARADAVGRASSGRLADHPARADRVAVARLEVGARDPPAHSAVQIPAPTSAAAEAVATRSPCGSTFSQAISAPAAAIHARLDMPSASSTVMSPAQHPTQRAPCRTPT